MDRCNRQFAGLVNGIARRMVAGDRPRHKKPGNNSAKGDLMRAHILKFIDDFGRDSGFPPSIREIGEAVGLQSSSTVWSHLKRLESDGLIVRDPGQPRSIRSANPGPTEAERLRALFVRLRDTIGSGNCAIWAIDSIIREALGEPGRSL